MKLFRVISAFGAGVSLLTLSVNSFAGKGNNYSTAEDYKYMLNAASNARVLEVLPKSCRYVTTDMFMAATASTVYLKGEILTIFTVHNELHLVTIDKGLGSTTNAQGGAMHEYRRSLYEMKASANQKIKFLKSAKNGFLSASSMALQKFAEQKKYFHSCRGDLKQAKNVISAILGCQGCSKTVGKSISLLNQREILDTQPFKSTKSEDNSQKLDHYLGKKMIQACGNFLCGLPLKGAAHSCDTFRRRFWKNQVYCHPEKIKKYIAFSVPQGKSHIPILHKALDMMMSTAVAKEAEVKWDKNIKFNRIEKDKAQEFNMLKGLVADFTNDWVAHARGRAHVYDAMAQEAQIAIDRASNIIKDLDDRIEDIEGDIAKFGGELKDLSGISLKNIYANSKPFPQCLTPKCMSFAKVFDLKKEDLAMLTPTHATAYKTFSEVADTLKSGKLDQSVLNGVSSINKKSTYFERYNKALAKKIKQQLAANGESFNFEGQVKQLLDNKDKKFNSIIKNPAELFAAIEKAGPEALLNKEDAAGGAKGVAPDYDSFDKKLSSKTSKLTGPAVAETKKEEEEEEGEEEIAGNLVNEKEKARPLASIPDYYHDPERSLWHVISRTYFKVFLEKDKDLYLPVETKN